MNPLCRAVAQSTRRRSFRSLSQSFYSSFSTPIKRSELETPRPREIPFQAKIANCVNLIGYISQPIQFQASPDDNKYWAASAITQSSTSDSPLWIPIIFEGDLAHVAASHLKENDHVYIAGQLTANPSPLEALRTQASVQIMVQNINFVKGSSHVTKGQGHRRHKEELLPNQLEEEPLKDSAVVNKNGDSVSNPWRDLIDNPKEWWDNRGSKRSGLVSPKCPDFKRKDGGPALWLDRAPVWALSEIEKVEFDIQAPRSKQAKPKGDESWKNLVENPSKWWDNRVNKINVKSPDFKHKETGEGLWLSSSPTWVLPKLPPLKGEKKVSTSRNI